MKIKTRAEIYDEISKAILEERLIGWSEEFICLELQMVSNLKRMNICYCRKYFSLQGKYTYELPAFWNEDYSKPYKEAK